MFQNTPELAALLPLNPAASAANGRLTDQVIEQGTDQSDEFSAALQTVIEGAVQDAPTPDFAIGITPPTQILALPIAALVPAEHSLDLAEVETGTEPHLLAPHVPGEQADTPEIPSLETPKMPDVPALIDVPNLSEAAVADLAPDPAIRLPWQAQMQPGAAPLDGQDPVEHAQPAGKTASLAVEPKAFGKAEGGPVTGQTLSKDHPAPQPQDLPAPDLGQEIASPQPLARPELNQPDLDQPNMDQKERRPSPLPDLPPALFPPSGASPLSQAKDPGQATDQAGRSRVALSGAAAVMPEVAKAAVLEPQAPTALSPQGKADTAVASPVEGKEAPPPSLGETAVRFVWQDTVAQGPTTPDPVAPDRAAKTPPPQADNPMVADPTATNPQAGKPLAAIVTIHDRPAPNAAPALLAPQTDADAPSTVLAPNGPGNDTAADTDQPAEAPAKPAEGEEPIPSPPIAPRGDIPLAEADRHTPQAPPVTATSSIQGTAAAVALTPASRLSARPPMPEAVMRVAETIASRKHEAPGKIELTLTPETLGRVHFEMRTDRNVLSVTLSAERQETLDLIRRHLPDLVAELKQTGIQTGNFSFSGWQEGRHTPAAPPPPVLDEAAPPVTRHTPLAPLSPKPFKPQGALDLRV